MTYAQRWSGQRPDRRTAARFLVAAALMLGMIAMHGLTMPPMSAAAMPASASPAVADVATTIGVAAAALHPVGHDDAAAMAAFADIGMPMPGGHPGHGVMDLCLAILAGLGSLALLAAALARRRHTSVIPVRSAIPSTRWVQVSGARRRLAPSITTLCVSRT